MNTTVCKLPEDTGDGYYRLWVEWSSSNFKIMLLQNESAWSGHASYDHIQQLSHLLKLPVDDYIIETKTALSTQGGASSFSYVVEDGQFIWKKLDQCSNIRMKYGWIQLEKTPYHEMAKSILDSLLEQCCNAKTEVVKLQMTNMVAAQERTVLMNKLVEYKKQKLEMERQLFSQFLVVLNSKKEYIQQLEDKFPGGNREPAVMKKSSHKPFQHEMSPNHHDSDTELEDTDDERKIDSSSVGGDTDDLFDDMQMPVSDIPRHISRPKRRISEAVASLSTGQVTGVIVDSGHAAVCGTQDLLDGF